MRFEPSAWRASDAVTYELVNDALNALTALLLARSPSGSPSFTTALVEASTTRREFLSLDAFDRDALDDFHTRITARMAELRAARP